MTTNLDDDDDFEVDKKPGRIIIKRIYESDDDEPVPKRPTPKRHKDDDDFEDEDDSGWRRAQSPPTPPYNPDDHWKNLKPSIYAKNLEEYFQSLHDDKEEEYWKRHPKEMDEREREDLLKKGVNPDDMPSAMFRVSFTTTRDQWAKLLNKYVSAKNIYVGYTSTTNIDEMDWAFSNQLIFITSFNVYDKTLGLLPSNYEPKTKRGGHSTVIIFFPKEKQFYSFDSAGWLNTFDKVKSVLQKEVSVSSSLKHVLDRKFWPFIDEWNTHVRALKFQGSGKAPSGSCGTFACWFALWSALYPRAVLNNYSPPMFPGSINTFLSFVIWCIENQKIELPDEIVNTTLYVGEVGSGYFKKRSPFYNLFLSLTV